MVVDLMRSAYKTEVKFFKDSDLTTTVQWYRVAPTTPVLPFPTIFSSYNWDIDNAFTPQSITGTPLQGEQLGASRNWVPGNNITDAVPSRPCGSAEQWAGDLSIADWTPPERDGFGTPLCCQRRTGPFVHFACIACPQGAWSTFQVYIPRMNPSGGFPCDTLFGWHNLTYAGNCEWWEGDPVAQTGLRLRITSGSGGKRVTLNRVVNGHTAGLFYVRLLPWDCQAPIWLEPGSGADCNQRPYVFVSPPNSFTLASGAQLFYDAFTDADGTPLQLHLPTGNDEEGLGWVVSSGQLQIGLPGFPDIVSSVGGSGLNYGLMTSSSPDLFCEAYMQTFETGNGLGIMLRHSDPQNFWLIDCTAFGGGSCTLFECVSGVFHARATSAPSIIPGRMFSVGASFVGGFLSAYVNNLHQFDYSVPGVNPGASGFGIKLSVSGQHFCYKFRTESRSTV